VTSLLNTKQKYANSLLLIKNANTATIVPLLMVQATLKQNKLRQITKQKNANNSMNVGSVIMGQGVSLCIVKKEIRSKPFHIKK